MQIELRNTSTNVWWRMMRPHTLTASFVPVFTGTAMALHDQHVQVSLFIAMLVASMLIQAATNMFNEYYDYLRGLDTKDSVGIGGTIVRDGIAPVTVRNLAILFYLLSAAIGLYICNESSWWIALIGGVALLYIAWTFLRELLHHGEEEAAEEGAAREKTLAQALWQIVLADVSMSLDNVLAVAAVARNDVVMLVIGLSVSIVLMGLLGGVLARLLDRFKVIAYVGVALIAWIGLELMWDGTLNANAALHLGLPVPAPHGEPSVAAAH